MIREMAIGSWECGIAAFARRVRDGEISV